MAEVAERTVTKEDLFNAILRYEEAGDKEKANQVRAILARDFPNAQQEIRLDPPQEYEYTEEQKLKNAENQALVRERENLEIIAGSKHLGNVPIQAGLNAFSSGYIGIGEHLDEAVGAVHGEDQMEYVRRLQQAFEEEYPKTNIALRLGGGVFSTIPVGSYAGTQKLYAWLQTLPKRFKYPIGMGAGGLFGIVEGFTSGTGIQPEGETGGSQSRGENAMDLSISGGIWGSLGAGFGHTLTDVGAKAWVSIKQGLKNNTIKEIKELFNLQSGRTAEIIKRSIEDTNLTFNDLMENLRKGGRDAQIPDADDAMAKLLDTIQIQGGTGASIVVNKVRDRATRQYGEVEKVLDNKVGALEVDPETGLKMDAKDMAKKIAQDTAPARSAAYKNAYKQKINYNAPEGKAVLDFIKRIEPKILQQAMAKANARLRWNQEELGQEGFKLGKDGLLKMVNRPNMLQLDYLKRALGELAYGTEDVMKGGRFIESPDAQLYTQMYTALNKVLKNVNKPKEGDSLYSQATKLGQDKIQRSNAIDIGQQILNPKYSANDVARVLKDAGDAEKTMARFGFRTSIEETLNNVKRTVNSPEIDINKVNTLLKSMSTDNVRGKLSQLFPEKDVNRLMKQFETAETALALRASVAQGSQSAQRLISARNMDEIVDSGLMSAMGDIAPIRTSQLLAQKVLKSRVLTDRRKSMIMKELANAMLATKGQKARKQYEILYKAVKRGEATDEQLLKIAQFISTKITIAPINVTQTTMDDTETDENLLLGVSNLLQRQ